MYFLYYFCFLQIYTIFNLSNETIVCNNFDAYKTFMTSSLKLLVCENFIIKKKNN